MVTVVRPRTVHGYTSRSIIWPHRTIRNLILKNRSTRFFLFCCFMLLVYRQAGRYPETARSLHFPGHQHDLLAGTFDREEIRPGAERTHEQTPLDLAGSDKVLSESKSERERMVIVRSPPIPNWRGRELARKCGAAGRDDLLAERIDSASTPWVPTAYLVTAHDTVTITGAIQLINRLYDHRDLFVLHIDPKAADEFYRFAKQAVEDCGNIIMLDDDQRMDVEWGTYSIVQLSLNLLQAALAAKLSTPWQNAVYLDGTAWPLLDQNSLQTWYRDQPANSSSVTGGHPLNICVEPVSESLGCGRTPARCTDSQCSSMTHTPGGKGIYWGVQWVRLSRDAADYILFDESARAWQTFFNGTTVPDEHFFPSVLVGAEPAGRFPLSYGLHMYTDFVSECRSYSNPRPGSSPCYLGEQDETDLTSWIRDRYPFARKFFPEDIALKERLS